MSSFPRLLILCGIAIAITGCDEQDNVAELPTPIAMTEESVGHTCSMNILEHTGPKAQIHLAGYPYPIWFSQVRDAIAFTRSPEEHYQAVAVFVNDMGKATQWDDPGDDTWINASTAWFVVDSRKNGGMGVPEAVPFGDVESADRFIDQYGGARLRLVDIPDSYVLGPVQLNH